MKPKYCFFPLILVLAFLIIGCTPQQPSDKGLGSQAPGSEEIQAGQVQQQTQQPSANPIAAGQKANPEKCPDGIWDEAEQKDPNLCPEDNPAGAESSSQSSQQNQSATQEAKGWTYDVPYNILVSHILSNNLSAEDKAVLQSSLDDMKSGKNLGPYWDEVRIATSKDGLAFESTGKTVVTHASVPAAVVDDQGRIWLFYVDFGPEPIERLIRGEKVDFKAGFQGLAAAVSDDGFNFRKADLEIQGIVEGVAVDPHIVVATDGTFQLYYLGVPALQLSPTSGDPAKSPGAHNIYLATAKSDLSKWQQQGVAWTGPFGGADPVVWQIDDKTYYIASGGIGKSVDGGYSFQETRETELPRVNDNGGPPGTPDIIKVEGGYRLFHTTKAGIKSLFSKDGISWEEEEGIRGLGADPTVVKLKDGTYLMYYKAKTQIMPNNGT